MQASEDSVTHITGDCLASRATTRTSRREREEEEQKKKIDYNKLSKSIQKDVHDLIDDWTLTMQFSLMPQLVSVLASLRTAPPTLRVSEARSRVS